MRLGSLPGVRTAADRRWQALACALAVGLLAFLGWTAGQDLDAEGHARLVRYLGILIAAGLGVAAPHVLFPDPHVRLLQLANWTPHALLTRTLRRWLPVPLALAVPTLVLALSTDASWPVRLALAAEGLLATLGVGLYAFARFTPVGERMVAWETGEGGQGYRAIQTWAPPLRFQVPDGLVPGLLVTGETFLVGSAVAIGGQASGLSGWGVLPALALVLAASGAVVRLRPRFDRVFYGTGGVWSDAFRAAAGPASERAPVEYAAVYWAPVPLRPAVWAGLVALDRRLPLGRAVAAGLALVGAIEWVGAPPGVRTAALALVVLGANAAVVLTASDAVLPLVLTRRLHGARAWVAIRFLMNLRWLPPLVAVLLGLAWLSDRVVWTDAVVWAAGYVAVAALTAVATTVGTNVRARRLYA